MTARETLAQEGATQALPDAPRSPPAAPPGGNGIRMKVLRRGLILAVLAAAIVAAWWMLGHRPAARRRPPKPKTTLVEARRVTVGSARVAVPAMGIVKPAREVMLQPRVLGEVRSLHKDLLPGGLLGKGDVLVRIDAADYLLAVKQAQNALDQARAALELEKGRQVVVRRELALLGTTSKDAKPALVLRQPQLHTAEAAVRTAEAALARARLDLDRTTLRAPWNAVVVSRGVEVGSRVTTATALVKLAGTDAYWVELVVPLDQLRWIRVPVSSREQGARVRIHDATNWGPAGHREGRVIRLAPDLEEKGRLARVLVEVADPLAREPAQAGTPRLQLGAYVEAEIEGEELPRVIALDRRWLREGGHVWVMDARDRLDIRTVTLVHRGRDQVLVSGGLKDGEMVVTSELVAPVQGMLLAANGQARRSASKASKNPMAPGDGPGSRRP